MPHGSHSITAKVYSPSALLAKLIINPLRLLLKWRGCLAVWNHLITMLTIAIIIHRVSKSGRPLRAMIYIRVWINRKLLLCHRVRCCFGNVLILVKDVWIPNELSAHPSQQTGLPAHFVSDSNWLSEETMSMQVTAFSRYLLWGYLIGPTFR